ncbi:MAG: hypothetical protein K8M05_06185, partial [Deltaproteobacteria bacterium]|nr:hypothetical protein [Kofleriaceae bacterium]
PLTISVTELPAADAWSITWTLAAPAPSIIFDRRIPSNRHETWRLPDELVWDRDPSGDYEILRAADHAARTTFTATFPSDTRDAGRAPSLNVRFTDGSRLLFTAQVGAYGFTCEPRCRRLDRDHARRWHFRTTPGRSLRVLDRAAPAELVWDEPAGDVRGTYLYAGSIAATRHERVTLVADPGLPAWLAADTTRLLPELFAFHGDATGVALDFVPLVLASHTDPGRRDEALRGRTLPRLIHLEAIGKDWARASPARRARWYEVLAHEAFHLWNAQLARRSGEKRDEWLSEGSAVYVAGLALVDAGLLTPRAHEDRILEAANGCIATLRGPLHAEAADASYYACGELVHFLVDRALADRGGVLAVWAAMIAHARAHGSYATADFLAAIDRRAGSAPVGAAVTADVRRILDVGLGTDPAARVRELLERARLRTKPAPGGRRLVRRR